MNFVAGKTCPIFVQTLWPKCRGGEMRVWGALANGASSACASFAVSVAACAVYPPGASAARSAGSE
jgi:hypothetical protein